MNEALKKYIVAPLILGVICLAGITFGIFIVAWVNWQTPLIFIFDLTVTWILGSLALAWILGFVALHVKIIVDGLEKTLPF